MSVSKVLAHSVRGFGDGRECHLANGAQKSKIEEVFQSAIRYRSRMKSELSDAELNAVGQIGLTVDDIDKARTFYRDVLSLKHLFDAPPAMCFFACGTVRLMLSKPERAGA